MKHNQNEEAVEKDKKACKREKSIECVTNLEEKMIADNIKAKALPAQHSHALVHIKRSRNIMLITDSDEFNELEFNEIEKKVAEAEVRPPDSDSEVLVR